LDIKEIKAIVDLMKRSALTEFQLEEKDLKLKICRKSDEVQTIYQAATGCNSTAEYASGGTGRACR
jgi:hypothetical protein